MSTAPHTPSERALWEAFMLNRSVPHSEEVLPFADDPSLCKVCGGDLMIVQIRKHRRGKIVTQVPPEQIVCPRCDGLSQPHDADDD